MPKIISYTPSWLSRPSPGFQVFNTAQSPSAVQSEQKSFPGDNYYGPTRTIARRGTEIFLAVGKKLRWADLTLLKDGYEEQLRTPSKKPKSNSDATHRKEEDEGPEDASYRVLKIPVSEQIRQLAISPNGHLLAIATAHTILIAILPDSSHLGQIPNKSIKLKTFAVGPTIHVLSQSSVTNILWHPCGVGGNCLVTVTADAAIRLWEFNRVDKSSVARPSLAIDLKKLVGGSSQQEDFSPDDSLRNRAFSSDDVGFEVASACFGGSGSEFESAWSPMALWIAMKGGDIYVLCPLLPSKWQMSESLIGDLSEVAVAKDASKRNGKSPEVEEKPQCDDQIEWIRDIDGQEPIMPELDDELSFPTYDRPSCPGPVPRLQGPFRMFSEDKDEDLEFSDIHVVASKTKAEDTSYDDESDSEVENVDGRGLSAAIVALMTTSGRVYVCLDLEGVESQWLPRKKSKHLQPTSKDADLVKDPYLVVLEGLDTLSRNEQLDLQWPTFSQDVNSRYSLFATHSHGVFYLSFDPWIENLEKELWNSEKLGAPLRINLIKNGPGTLRERVLSFEQEEDLVTVRAVSACLSFQDSDLGYFLLTSVDGHPEAATFNQEHQSRGQAVYRYETEEEEASDHMPEMGELNLGPTRAIYQPADAFYAESSLPRFLEKNVHSRHKRMMKEEVRLSTVTLDLMAQAHRVLSQETHRLGLAASDLFRRCDRLRKELSDQVNRANEVAQRTEKVAGEDADPYLESIRTKEPSSLQERLEKVRSRQEELTKRYENLRKKFSTTGGRVLSEKEQSWISEMYQAAGSIHGPPETEDGEDEDIEQASELWRRCDEADKLKGRFIKHANEVSQQQEDSQSDGDIQIIPDGIRRSKLMEVKKLLAKQTVTVEDAQTRLQRLNELVIP